MAGVYRMYMEGLEAANVTRVAHFSSIGSYSKYGSWGLMEAQDWDPSEAPKLQARIRLAVGGPEGAVQIRIVHFRTLALPSGMFHTSFKKFNIAVMYGRYAGTAAQLAGFCFGFTGGPTGWSGRAADVWCFAAEFVWHQFIPSNPCGFALVWSQTRPPNPFYACVRLCPTIA
jgi:hypothetical protein